MPGKDLRGHKGDAMGHNARSVRIYLLTVWQEAGQEAAIWRFRLEDPHTHWRCGFVDAQDLMALLDHGVPPPETNVEKDNTKDKLSRHITKLWFKEG